MSELDGFDVIVVGAGTAGLPTTLSSLENGLRVLLLEKEDQVGGTLWITGASYSAAGTRMQQEQGIEDSWQEHVADANAIGHGHADQEILELAAREAHRGVDWLEELGLYFGDSPRFGPEHELYSKARTHYQMVRTRGEHTDNDHPMASSGTAEGTGVNMLRTMRAHIAPYVVKGQCMVLRGHQVTRLLVQDGRVTGVEIERRDGSTLEAHAPATVLATGGYAANRELLKRFNPDRADVLLMTSPTSMGEGLLMAEGIGARITHTEFMNPGVGGIEDPARPGWVMLWVLINSGRPVAETGDIWVNSDGRRFMREDHPSHDHKEKALVRQPGMAMYSIYDSAHRMPDSPAGKQWIIEVEGRDIAEHNIKKANSVAELAAKIGCEPAVLQATIDDWNAAVDAGKDEAFGREAFKGKILEAPFYALRSRSHILLTRGGVKINVALQVVRDDAAETPIPGLYAVGEVIGNGRTSGDASVGGFAVGPCFTLGKLLGERLPGYIAETRAAVPARA